MDFNELLDPIKIKNLEIKNRFAMAPMNMGYSTQDGYVTQQDIAHLARRAKGGFGLLITGAVIATKMAAPYVWHRNLLFYNSTFVPGMNMMTDACHAFGAKVFVQLSVGFGRQGKAIDGRQPYAPSAAVPVVVKDDMRPKGIRKLIQNYPALDDGVSEKYYLVPREMTKEEIRSEEKEFGESCRRAVLAGFDGIEIHAPHGYLEHQFLSPLSNKRTDEYGGSLENRMRFMLEVAESALEGVKDAIPVGIRISLDERVPGGFTFDDVKEVCKRFQSMGVAFLELSDGCAEAMKYFLPDTMEDVEKYMLKDAKRLKEEISLPTITPSVSDPVIAKRVIKDGTTDMISLARQSLADPDFPNKIKEGKIDKIAKCTRDDHCLTRPWGSGLPVRCSVNPEVGFEQYDMELFPKKRPGPVLPPAMKKLPGLA